MKHLNYFCNYKHIICKNLLLICLIAGLFVTNTPNTYASKSVSVMPNGTISISVKNKTVKEAFQEIEKQSKFVFVYNSEAVNLNQKVSVEANGETIRSVMNKLLKETNLNYEISDRQIAVFNKANKKENVKNAPFTVSGRITDESTGETLIGVSVTVKGTTQGTITDIDGNYSLNVPNQNVNLVFSYIGFTKAELQAQKTLNVKLKSEAKAIEEVVVVGYGTVKKKDLTGAASTIKAKDFNVGLVTAPSQLIQGRIAGVSITNNGGEPGGEATIRVRGSNSIRSGQDPLYVIDGLPLNVSDDQQPGGANIAGVGDAGKKNPLNFLNPDDIESIDVLKDASATAIYGARGANGVIIVTTKKGKEGIAKVSYSGSVSISSLPKQYEMLSADQFRAYGAEKGLKLEDGGANTNWQDEIFRTSLSHSHNLSMSGGTKNSNYRASLGYLKQDGIIRGSGMDKYTGRFAISQKTLNDRLLIEASLMAARNTDQRVPIGQSGGFEGDVLLSALKLNPTLPVYNADGTYLQKSKDVRNPVAMINLTNDKTETDRILGNITGTLSILKDLNYKLNVAVDQTKATRKVTQDKSLIYMTDNGTADINNIEAGNYLIENYMTYNFNLARKHSFNVLAGHSYQRFRNYNYGLAETGFTTDNIEYINDLELGKYKQVTANSGIVINELQSFFGRVNYNLVDKYLVTVNFRADGSTKFGDKKKYGYFPSAAFAWRASEEEFIKKLNIFDNLKVRLSWGLTGNQEIPNKISQMTLTSTSGAILNGGSTVVPGITLGRTPNPYIQWESSEQYDLGLDFSILRGRLSGTIDLFSKTTKNAILQAYAGDPSPNTNVWKNETDMKIKNRGLEIGLNGVLIATKDINWKMGVNFSTIKNEVVDLPMSYLPTSNPSGPGITGFTSQVIKSGYPIGTFWGYNFLGFDDKGKSLYELDANGKRVEKCIGNAQPDFTLNLNTSFSYKRFDLGLFFNGVFGNDVYNNLANVMDQLSLFSKGFNTTVEATKRPEALDNVLDYSSRYIENGSYLRLSSATLGYTFNMKNNKWVSNLRVFATGNNLFVLTKYSGYDPEVNASRSSNGVPSLGIGWTTYPMARTFSFGVSMDF